MSRHQPNKRLNIVAASIITVFSMLLATLAVAGNSSITLVSNANGLVWQINGNGQYESTTLRLSMPNGKVLDKTYTSGNPTIDIPLVDGNYTYEVNAYPKSVPASSASSNNEAARNGRSASQASRVLLGTPLQESGYFNVLNGQVIDKVLSE